MRREVSKRRWTRTRVVPRRPIMSRKAYENDSEATRRAGANCRGSFKEWGQDF
ncbi:hypothetical protein JMJ78_0008167, partial [Colletotrichum scovillei]